MVSDKYNDFCQFFSPLEASFLFSDSIGELISTSLRQTTVFRKRPVLFSGEGGFNTFVVVLSASRGWYNRPRRTAESLKRLETATNFGLGSWRNR